MRQNNIFIFNSVKIEHVITIYQGFLQKKRNTGFFFSCSESVAHFFHDSLLAKLKKSISVMLLP